MWKRLILRGGGGMNEWMSQYMEAGGRTACVEILRCGND